VDAAALFPDGAAAYLRLEGALLSKSIRAMLSPEDIESLRAFLDRTDRVTAAVFLPNRGDGFEGASSGLAVPNVTIYGLAEGSYPAGAATFRLRVSPEWRKEGKTLVNRGGELRLAFAGRDLLAVGNGDLDPLLTRLSDPGPHPVPEDLRPLWEAEGALWLSRPVTVLQALMGSRAPAVPARAALLSLSPESGAYKGTWVFEFADERSARVYGPLCRLAHYAWIRAAYGSDVEGADDALSRTRWRTDGNRVYGSGFSVRGEDVFRAFAREP